MAINKVQFGSNTLIDITDTTTETEDVIEGKVFYAKDGVRSVGSLGDATQAAHGLMSATDKAKLDKISTMIGATSSEDGASGLVPAPTTSDINKFLAGDGTYKDGGQPMVVLSYGKSVWNDFIEAYNNHVIVYCRASSNSNPASGAQGRMAFMAYVNNGDNPTEVEFQYYRSVSSHSATQMGDQVFVYKLNKTNGWSVTTREASIKQISAGSKGNLSVAWNSNKVTIDGGLPAVTSSDNDKILKVANGAWTISNLTSVPTKISDLTNDVGYITGYIETDPTVPEWAKAATKPVYTAAEVGAIANPIILDADISQQNNGVSGGGAFGSILFKDLNSNTIGALTTNASSDGTTKIMLGLHNQLNGSSGNLYFTISSAKNGNVTYSVPAPGAFRSAIGAVDASAIPTKVSDLNNDSGFLTASTGVSGVKGNSESTYRTGNVSITPANIGAYTTGETDTAIETRLAPTDMSSHFTINTSLSATMQSKIQIQQAKRFGSMVAVCVRLDAGFSGSGATLFYIDDVAKPAKLAYVVPIFFNASGKINTEGAIWIENTNLDQVRYYGDTLSANSYFTIIYGLH